MPKPKVTRKKKTGRKWDMVNNRKTEANNNDQTFICVENLAAEVS